MGRPAVAVQVRCTELNVKVAGTPVERKIRFDFVASLSQR